MTYKYPQIGTNEFNELASVYFGGKPKQDETKQTAMQDLREDLILTEVSAKESLLEIENQEIREACQEVVRLTLKNIIKRIDEELLKTEKQQMRDCFLAGDDAIFHGVSKNEIKSFEQYYNETFKNK